MTAALLGLLFQSGELLAPFAVEAGGAPIDAPGGNSAPCVADWDGDGRFDLLVGEYEEGSVRFYRNVGERGAPRFAPGELLRHAEGPVKVPYG
jgi:hypothetical protein